MANWENVSETTLTDSKRIQIMFESVLYCARQGICMKGQIKKPLYQYSDDECDNDDQVMALTNFLLRVSNDDYNPNSRPKKPSNATSLTKQTQDRILETCGEMLTAKLVAKVKEAQFFSLIAEKTLKDDDGVRIPFFVRFVDKDLKIREDLLQYIPRGNRFPDETLAETFSKNILRGIEELGLNMKFCRGLNFDAGDNVGDVSEVVAKVQADYPKAIYVHARSDLLNVCIASTCEIRFVSYMLYQMKFTAKLFTEEEIQELLESMIKAVMPESEHSRLIELSHANWSGAVQQFANWVELFPAIIATYDEIREGPWRKWIRDGDKSCTADGISLGMVEFEFIICMVIAANCLELTIDLTDELQKICYDSSTIREKVSKVRTKLDELKSNIEDHHSAWYEKAVALATKIDIKPQKGKIYHSKHETNPDESISEHYLKSITLPFLDHIKAQIELRFSEANLDALDGLAIMPSNVVANPENWRTAASRFMARCTDDQPDHIYYDAELRLWETSWKMSESQPPDTALELLSLNDLKYRTQISTAFKVFATMPIIPTESETLRVMPFIHEELCLYSMSDSYLNALALLSIRGKELETDDVIECYRKKYTLPLVLDDA